MSWIKTINYADSTGKLRRLYDRVKGPNNQVDQVLQVHSLRPHTLEGHMALYKNALHHQDNTLPLWYLELIGVLVSHWNQCKYCVMHHAVGVQKALQDETQFEHLMIDLDRSDWSKLVGLQYALGIQYAKLLTRNMSKLSADHVDLLRANGCTDAEVLEINQVTAYFNYVNRVVLGLGVEIMNEELGLSPDYKEGDWNHS